MDVDSSEMQGKEWRACREVQKGALLTIMINVCGFAFTLGSVTNTRLSIRR